MKIREVYSNAKYDNWIREVRKIFPNATPAGTFHKAQMVDWTSSNNEVAGDWDGEEGIIYKPGSMGKEILKKVK